MNPTQVPCPHCLASEGNPCIVPGTQQTLRLSPAHPSRLEKVGQQPAYSAVDRYRHIFSDDKIEE